MSAVTAVSQQYTGVGRVCGSGVMVGGKVVCCCAIYNVISKFLENTNDSRFMVEYVLY